MAAGATLISDEVGSTDVERDDGRPGHRRVRVRLGWLLGLGALVLVAAGWVALDRLVLSYQPIEFGCCTLFSDQQRTIAPPGGDEADIYRFEPTGEFTYGFNITNRGSRAVRVVDLPGPNTGGYAPLVRTEIGDGSTDNEVRRGGSPAEWVPFEPFTLGPGEFRTLRFTHRFPDCDLSPPDDLAPERFLRGTYWDRVPVEFEVFGVARRTEIAFGRTVAIEMEPGPCDDLVADV